jgi:hypothetical protein
VQTCIFLTQINTKYSEKVVKSYLTSKIEKMKKLFILGLAVVCSTSLMAQKETKKKEIRKEVQMEEKDGVKTLTITTSEDGKKRKEVYTGADADKKMIEMEKEEERMLKEAEADPNKKVIIKKEMKEKGDGHEGHAHPPKPEHPAHPSHPPHPERPEHPEHPEHPERPEHAKDGKHRMEKEVKVEEKDGVKHVCIKTTKDGQVTKEEYVGAEADKKLKEMDAEMEKHEEHEGHDKKVIKKKS